MKRGIFFVVFVGILFGCVTVPTFVDAHQPSFVEKSPVIVENPEISRVFYDSLAGSPRVYRVSSDKDFDFFLSILTSKNATATFSGYVSRVDGDLETFVGALDGNSASWEVTYEPFGADWYRKGPEFDTRVPKGIYTISVFNTGNIGAYAIAIGKKESFGFGDIIRTMALLPKLKSDFFGSSHFTLFLSPFGILWALILAACITAGWKIFFFIFEKYIVLARETKEKLRRNIGRKDRRIRLFAGIFFFFIGIGSWSITLMVIGGFFFYEAFSGWCIFYALTGKSTCRAPQDLSDEE